MLHGTTEFFPRGNSLSGSPVGPRLVDRAAIGPRGGHLDRNAERPFDFAKAQHWIDRWVETADVPELTWAWAICQEALDVYATNSVTAGTSRTAARREVWRDWLGGFDGGDAHWGVHGLVSEFTHACPPELWSAWSVTLDEALEIGRTGRMPTERRARIARPRREAPMPSRVVPPPYLTLVVDNEVGPAR